MQANGHPYRNRIFLLLYVCVCVCVCVCLLAASRWSEERNLAIHSSSWLTDAVFISLLPSVKPIRCFNCRRNDFSSCSTCDILVNLWKSAVGRQSRILCKQQSKFDIHTIHSSGIHNCGIGIVVKRKPCVALGEGMISGFIYEGNPHPFVCCIQTGLLVLLATAVEFFWARIIQFSSSMKWLV